MYERGITKIIVPYTDGIIKTNSKMSQFYLYASRYNKEDTVIRNCVWRHSTVESIPTSDVIRVHFHWGLILFIILDQHFNLV